MTEENNTSRRNFLKNLSVSVPLISSGFFGLNSGNSVTKRTLDYEDKNIKSEGLNYDLVVYGATSAGVMAAYSAKMYGLHVMLIEPGRHLGGLSSGGLGRTDTGNEKAITGLSKEFYIRIGQIYGKQEPFYRFEPHVAELNFKRYIDEAEVEVLFSRSVKNVMVQNSRIKAIILEYSGKQQQDDLIINAQNFVDATYEGDLMAKSGVSYTVGRESNSVYNELYNGVIPGRVAGDYGNTKRTREWSVNVDPYIVPGKPSSGLLPEVNGIGHEPVGTGDNKVQAYCFRLCLTQNKTNQIPLSEPEGYDPYRYELMARLQKLEPWESLRNGFIISEMPNGKTDINNYGLVGFSSNYVGKNFDYPDAEYPERERIWNEHKKYQQGLLWFLATDERIPSHIRKQMNSWGYCRDEFLDTGGWPHQLYIREARRMVSDFVMTEHECVGKNPINDGIAMGAYALDSHVVQRVVIDDHVENEGNISVHGFDPYYISYRAIIPKSEEISNLIVPVCISSSHAAYGSIRMEPVFMELGHAAGVASWLAVKNDQKVHEVNVTDIKKELRENPLVNRKIPREYSGILPFHG